MKKMCAFALVCLLLVVNTFAEETASLESPQKNIVLGLTYHDAERFNTEFFTYRRMVPLFTENHIEGMLIEQQAFLDLNLKDDELDKLLSSCHVIHLSAASEGTTKVTPAIEARAKRIAAALNKFVQAGGGLFLHPKPTRYPNTEDEKYWNLIMEPFGAQILHEGVFDKTHTFEGKTTAKATFWYTSNVVDHPVTKGVKSLYLPMLSATGQPGIIAMQYSPQWQVLVHGEKQASSYKTGYDNLLLTNEQGTYKSEPPVFAVRECGKGRVACYPISDVFTGINYGNPLWASVVETAGDPDSHRPSDSMKLQINAYKWLGQNALANSSLGTYKRPPYKPVQFDKTIDQDKSEFRAPMAQNIRGIFGAHTAYSDGVGTVDDYVKAAKAAGLSFVVFNEACEKLSPENFKKLKEECLAASKDGKFYACPGIEFTDGPGNRWAIWGDKVLFPEKTFREGDRDYKQWDGQVVTNFGGYVNACALPGCALLDFKQLTANGCHKENLWWFYHYFPLVYEKDKLIADNFAEYLFGLSDLRAVAVASYTRIKDPADVKIAAATCVTEFNDLPHATKALNSWGSPEGLSLAANEQVSQGPSIVLWQSFGPQGNWRYTRGVQRVRLKFVVRSEAGIAEVKVHDANYGIVRNFSGNGQKELSSEFELVNDRQHYLTLEVTDVNGKRAFSQDIRIYYYSSGFYRCGDNLNILGSSGLVWHPDRNEMMQLFKNFANGYEFSIRGWDSGAPLAPMPKVRPPETISIKGVGDYPTLPPSQFPLQRTVVSKLMEIPLASYNFQIATMRMNKLAESTTGTGERPSPAQASLPRDRGDLEYFERTHTIYSPMDRLDHTIIWNERRDREGRQNYRGGVMWHEGEIRFKKDVVLQGSVPIPLVQMMCPTDIDRKWGTTLVAQEPDGKEKIVTLEDLKKPLKTEGHVRPGGFVSQMPAVVGYMAFLAPIGSDFTYSSSMPGEMKIGLGVDGQVVKAGTVMPYRFAMATFAGAQADPKVPADAANGFNMNGGRDGYSIAMKTGEVADTVFFFTSRTYENEAAFTLGPRKLIIDLPIRVQGVDDNGCVAVYSTLRPWFRYVSVVKDTAYFQESIDNANELWVGNVFVSDDKNVKITLVVDGQSEGKKPFIELHNPTNKAIRTKVWSPAHTPMFGGMNTLVDLPAGKSLFLTIDGNQFKKKQ